jgi:nicotinamide riboside transporter PnuC
MEEEATRQAVPGWRPRLGLSRGDVLFCVAVVVVYVIATDYYVVWSHLQWDRMMTLAEQAVQGRLDSPAFKGTVDSVDIGGRYYVAVGPLQLLPYLPFALVGSFQDRAGLIISCAFGSTAGALALPLARAYGARGSAAYWVASAAAFGSLLFYVSVSGNFYYLAQAESFLALTLFLIEWAGPRRAMILGLYLAISFLARPTTILAAIPFGLALIWRRPDAFRLVVMAGLPVALGIGIYGWFNWARFGSPLETGYAISYLTQPGLEPRRALGLFSILQVPENIRLALLTTFQPLGHSPYFTASPYGLSMLLVSPALLAALWAGLRDRGAYLLWAAAGLVAIPVFLYYGGGYVQYGFRYSLDFTPFLIALMALGSNRWKGPVERVAIIASIVSVTYGVLWHSMLNLRQ